MKKKPVPTTARKWGHSLTNSRLVGFLGFFIIRRRTMAARTSESNNSLKQYNGTFFDGKMHGHGKALYVDDSWYNGDWVKGMHDLSY